MEVDSEVLATAETAGAAESEACLVQSATMNDGDCDLTSNTVVASDASLAVTVDSAVTPTVNDNSVAVDIQTTSTSASLDVGVVESASSSSYLSPSTAPATTTSDLSLPAGSSVDWSTQCSSADDVNTVQSARHVDPPHLESSLVLENASSLTTTTTMNTSTTVQEDAPRKDDELHSAAAVIDEPPPSSNSEQQEPQPQQHPEQPHKDEDVQVQDFKAG